MKKIVTITLCAVVITLLTGQARAADICFEPDTAARMVVELQQCRIDQGTMQVLQEMNDNLQGRVKAEEEVIAEQEEKIAASEDAIAKMEKLLDEQGRMYEEKIREARPSFFQEVLKGAGYVAAGIIVGVLILH